MLGAIDLPKPFVPNVNEKCVGVYCEPVTGISRRKTTVLNYEPYRRYTILTQQGSIDKPYPTIQSTSGSGQ
jgi:hypothetical protein